MANVLGTEPVVPERVNSVRRTGGAVRLFSGIILRAVLTFGPAMWQCISTPPGITTMPCASIVRSGRFSGFVRRGDNAAAVDPHITDLAPHAIARIVNGPVGDPQHLFSRITLVSWGLGGSTLSFKRS